MNNSYKPSINNRRYTHTIQSKLNTEIALRQGGTFNNINNKIKLLYGILEYRIDINHYLTTLLYRIFGLLICLYDYSMKYGYVISTTPIIEEPYQIFFDTIKRYNQELSTFTFQVSDKLKPPTMANPIEVQRRYLPNLRTLVNNMFDEIDISYNNLLEAYKSLKEQNANKCLILTGNV